jgi:hypothetical protein
MSDLEEFLTNLAIFFVLFCISGWIYTGIARRSPLLKSTVGL